jgi:hypothetical protein
MLRSVIASEIVTSSPAARARARLSGSPSSPIPARIWLALVVYAFVYSIWRNLAGAPDLGETFANRAAFVVPSLLVTCSRSAPRAPRDRRRLAPRLALLRRGVCLHRRRLRALADRLGSGISGTSAG